jgi:hypothetical protein
MIIDVLGETPDAHYQPQHMRVDDPNVSALDVLVNSVFSKLMAFSLV